MSLEIPQATCFSSQIFWMFVFLTSSVFVNYIFIFPEARKLFNRNIIKLRKVQGEIVKIQEYKGILDDKIENNRIKYENGIKLLKSSITTKADTDIKENYVKIIDNCAAQKRKIDSIWADFSKKFVDNLDAGKIGKQIGGSVD